MANSNQKIGPSGTATWTSGSMAVDHWELTEMVEIVSTTEMNDKVGYNEPVAQQCSFLISGNVTGILTPNTVYGNTPDMTGYKISLTLTEASGVTYAFTGVVNQVARRRDLRESAVVLTGVSSGFITKTGN